MRGPGPAPGPTLQMGKGEALPLPTFRIPVGCPWGLEVLRRSQPPQFRTEGLHSDVACMLGFWGRFHLKQGFPCGEKPPLPHQWPSVCSRKVTEGVRGWVSFCGSHDPLPTPPSPCRQVELGGATGPHLACETSRRPSIAVQLCPPRQGAT